MGDGWDLRRGLAAFLSFLGLVVMALTLLGGGGGFWSLITAGALLVNLIAVIIAPGGSATKIASIILIVVAALGLLLLVATALGMDWTGFGVLEVVLGVAVLAMPTIILAVTGTLSYLVHKQHSSLWR